MSKPLKVVISGSFRKHLKDIGIAIERFNKAGVQVLAPLTERVVNGDSDFVFLVTDDPGKTADVLEKEFMGNILRADFLYLANVGGYVGRSAAAEIATAVMNNIPIIASEEVFSFSNEVHENAQRILKRVTFKCVSANKIAEIALAGFVSIELSETEKNVLRQLITSLLNDLKNVKLVA